jgi:hypothetical protein
MAMNPKPREENVLSQKIMSDEAHYQFLKAHPNEQWGVGYLYTRLNIIDSKTNALLRVNNTIIGFLGAIVVFILGHGSDFPLDKKSILLPIIGLLLVLVTSDCLSFLVFRIRFDRIADENDFVRYRRAFYKTTALRERLITWVSGLSLIGELGFVLLFVCLAVQELRHH